MLNVTPVSASEAAKAKSRDERRGWKPGKIEEAVETTARESGNPVIALRGTCDGSEWRDWVNFSARGAEKLRHFLAAVSDEALARYEAGEIDASAFVGVMLDIRFDVQKRNGFNRSVVTDYRRQAG